MFPSYDGTTKGPLRCYTDEFQNTAINPFYPWQDWNRQDCEQVLDLSRRGFPEERTIEVYPSPFFDVIRLSSALPLPARYRVCDLNGRLLHSGWLPAGEISIDLSHLPAGFYFLELTNKESAIVRKIIKCN
ncbi:MAG: T9SS type A sorting domain-containing protein [Bacteroidota bacterium]